MFRSVAYFLGFAASLLQVSGVAAQGLVVPEGLSLGFEPGTGTRGLWVREIIVERDGEVMELC